MNLSFCSIAEALGCAVVVTAALGFLAFTWEMSRDLLPPGGCG